MWRNHSLIILGSIAIFICGIIQAQYLDSFDLRNVNDTNYVTSVKNQTGGTCWTHGTMASIESDLLMSGNWQVAGDTGEPNLAEYHLDWWNGFNQFYNADILPDSGDGLQVHQGGDYYVAAAYLSRGDGAVRDIDGQLYSSPPDSFSYNYHVYYPRDIEWYSAGEDLSHINLIKEKLMTEGAIATCLYSSGEFLQNGIHYQPASSSYLPNHSVTIVGWDDNLMTQAPSPGAWLCKNSWGTGWAFDGYFWISYEDKSCAKNVDMGAVAFNNVELLPPNKPKYFYYHDYHGWRDEVDEISRGFNAFAAVRNHALEAVSFYTTTDSVDYTLRIYDTFDGAELLNELGSKTGHIQYRGFHTVDLIDTIPLTRGNDFYVYVEFSRGGQAFDRSSEIPVLLGANTKAFVRSSAAPKQSYIFDGGWIDMYSLEPTANLCIKAIANDNLTSPIKISSISDGGDGKTLLVSWEFATEYDQEIDFIRMYYSAESSSEIDSVTLDIDDTTVLLDNLIEDKPYFIFARSFSPGGDFNPDYIGMTGTPSSIPEPPENLSISPAYRGISLTWAGNNSELDFHHYQLIRDGVLLPQEIADTTYFDSDPSLGDAYHEYFVLAVDNAGNQSDTTGLSPAIGKAAALAPGTILAVNKSNPNSGIYLVQDSITGQFLQQALAQYDYRYIYDTLGAAPLPSIDEMIDYELIVIGAESARCDDLTSADIANQGLHDLGKYMSIGGKVIIFGRWGDIKLPGGRVFDTISYHPSDPEGHNHPYYEYFDIVSRTEIIDPIVTEGGTFLDGFCTGAQALASEYPDLHWDSLAFIAHNVVFQPLNGIPATSVVNGLGDGATPIYEYIPAETPPASIGTISGWINHTEGHKYVYFELPLSFMERTSAIQALQQAIYSLDVITDVTDEGENHSLPQVLTLSQNYPNPFNPRTTIEFYNPGSTPLKVTIEVFNIVGQLVNRIYDDYATPGVHRVIWEGNDMQGSDVASGIYLYRISADDTSQAKKMILLR